MIARTWTIRDSWRDSAMFTIAHVLGVLYIEDYNDISASHPRYLPHFNPSPRFFCPYNIFFFLLYSSILHPARSSNIACDHTRIDASTLYISPLPSRGPANTPLILVDIMKAYTTGIRRSSTQDVKVKCDTDSSWCHDVGVRLDWLFLSCPVSLDSLRKRRDDIHCRHANIVGSSNKNQMFAHAICDQFRRFLHGFNKRSLLFRSYQFLYRLCKFCTKS